MDLVMAIMEMATERVDGDGMGMGMGMDMDMEMGMEMGGHSRCDTDSSDG